MKDGISFIENEKRPGIDLRGGWVGGQVSCVIAVTAPVLLKKPLWRAYPFHTRRSTSSSAVAAALPAATARVSVRPPLQFPIQHRFQPEHGTHYQAFSAGARKF